ncbi:MAG TPA: serine/threonine-protein kinase, partial [Candidatus Dormibacteraeota bacterium]|nr:serine/threonine-protein kinase [Candidatus Dormibacteraeota bacterium]
MTEATKAGLSCFVSRSESQDCYTSAMPNLTLKAPVGPGDQLDHYRIESVIASGSTVVIFQGTDLQTGRAVAIKIPHPEMETDLAFLDRLRREEDIDENLSHPGLLKGIKDEHRSRFYIVTEWFDGRTLRQKLNEQKKLSPEEAVQIALKLCDVLEYIHGHGIVHRNLRPENILVGADDQIKLTGLELAAKEGAPRLTFTSIAQLVGSSAYISPEELVGRRGDARSDLYSLGIILYEMVTGATPFPGNDPFDRLRKHPVPPRELDPAVTPQLQEVIYRALEREHKNRYASAHDFVRDLSQLDKVGIGERAELRDWKKDHESEARRLLLYTALALIPLLIFGLLIYFS